MRVACLLVPDLPLAAALRAHPELAGRPLAITSGAGPRAQVVAVSAGAARCGVHAFAPLLHARALCPSLVARPSSPALERTAREALLDVARSLSPRVAPVAPASGAFVAEAAVHLDASGVSALFRSEAGFANALTTRTRALGLPAVVAVASSRGVSLLAARELARGEGGVPRTDLVRVLEPGSEAAWLAPLPIDLLDADDALAEGLGRFGIRRIGELAALSPRALATRLGPDVLRLLALARAESDALPLPPPTESCFEEAIDLEYAVDRLEALGFVLRGLLARLAERLALRGLACGDLDLVLGLAGGARDVRRVGVAAPTQDARALTGLLRLALETRPPTAPVEQISLATRGADARRDQLDFFQPAGPAPATLARLLAELEALCGTGRVGAPGLADDPRPDAFTISAFAPPHAPGAQKAAASPHASLETAPDVAILSLRALRPAVAASVRAVEGRPCWLHSPVAKGHVLEVAGPWRTTGRWWSRAERFAFDHFDVFTDDGTLSRLRLDRVRRRWEIDGIYD
ncbi:MAG TPA: DNA polymerase Y family protein [Myxococcota bacterium]|nr:DNA polymerase Y family protein [Myxococcota bacterium]